MACQGCGSPKEDDEPYEMPGDTAAAATVTDPELLRMAKAGANWQCRYCGSHQRTLAGTCAQCGAAQGEGRSTDAVSPTRARRAPAARSNIVRPLVLGAAGVVLLALVGCGLFASLRSGVSLRGEMTRGGAALVLPFHSEDAKVVGIRWKQVVSVERWQVLTGEGFAESKPAEAFDSRPVEQRFHHTEKVLDGYDTQYYTETVPDGYRTETYTERESCGQECTSRPQSCSEKCTSNKNGFASCQTVCTGGGQSCQTKYCSVTKTRQVPQTKTVTKSRQVPRYRDEPRNATWYRWKIWGWKHDRTLEKTGTTLPTVWPDEKEVKLGKGLAAGEKEREQRSGSYAVDLVAGDQRRELPLAEATALDGYSVGSAHRLRVWRTGSVEAL